MHEHSIESRGYVPDTYILYLAPNKSDASRNRYHVAKVEPPHERIYDVDAERLYKIDTDRNRKLGGKAGKQGSESEALLREAHADEVRLKEELLRRGLDVKGGKDAMQGRLEVSV